MHLQVLDRCIITDSFKFKLVPLSVDRIHLKKNVILSSETLGPGSKWTSNMSVTLVVQILSTM